MTTTTGYANRYEQALSCIPSYQEAPDVVLVRDSSSQWLVPGSAWAAARRVMMDLPAAEDRAYAYAELYKRLRKSTIASTVVAACMGPQAERIVLVALAVRAGLIDEPTARAMSVAVPA